MERINEENINDILQYEHEDRYLFASDLIHGNVLDLACGIGYGSKILFQASTIKSYTGVDVSSDAIKYAKENYHNEKTTFLNESGLTIEFEQNSFDNIISFETLEHIEEYEIIVEKFATWLKNDGIFIGSVPDTIFENTCEEVYGKNPYHLVRFNQIKIDNLLKKYFKNIQYFTNELTIGSLFRSLETSESDSIRTLNREFSNKINGSIYFIATNEFDKRQINQNIFYPSVSLVEYDKLKVFPQSKLVAERDEYIKQLESNVNEMKSAIKAQDSLVAERDKYIKQLESNVDELKSAIKTQDSLVARVMNLLKN